MGSWIVSNGWQLFHFIIFLCWFTAILHLQLWILDHIYRHKVRFSSWLCYIYMHMTGLPKMEPVLKRDEFCPGHLWLAWDLWGSKENNTSPSICRILIPRETKKYAAASSEQWQYHGIVWRLVFNFDWSIRLWNTATPPPPPPATVHNLRPLLPTDPKAW